MTPPAWRGRSTWAASTSTRTRCSPATSTTPTNCGSTWTRCPGSRGGGSSTSRWWPARCWRTTDSSRGRRRPAPGAFTSMPGSPRAGRSARCGWPPRPLPARSSGGCPTRQPAAGGRKSAKGCSSTSTRTPRTAPSRRPIPCGPLPTPGCRRRCVGTRSPTASPRRSPWPPCPAGSPKWVIRGRGWTTRSASLIGCSMLAEEMGPAGARAEGVRQEYRWPPQLNQAAHRGRPHQDQGRGDGRAGHLA